MDNILALHQDLKEKTYKHGSYHAFKINDPKSPIFTKSVFEIELSTTQSIRFFIRILSRSLFLILILTETTKGLIVKRKLKVKYCIRYADDFIILSRSKSYLFNLIPQTSKYLENELKLSLHQDKIYIKSLASGVDFLGWAHFPHHRVLRTSTKLRMFKRLKQSHSKESIASYLGLLKHGNTHKLVKRVLEYDH